MIRESDLKNGRVKVMSGKEYAEANYVHESNRPLVGRMDIVLTGCIGTSGKLQVPHPGFTGYGDDQPQENGVATLLRRDQAEDLTLELLKALNGGAMPDDSAELVDFISALGR